MSTKPSAQELATARLNAVLKLAKEQLPERELEVVLAKIGAIAVVDEVTGYQKNRTRGALIEALIKELHDHGVEV